MKKQLLLLASAILAFHTANAQYLKTPKALSNVCYTATSPNGKFTAGTDPYTGELTVYNFETSTKKTYKLQDPETEWYDIGTGANSISNNGIVTLSTTYECTAAYIENGKVNMLPVPDNSTSALSNSITPDGKRIAGSVGMVMDLQSDDIMQHPVIWNRQADGTYSAPVELPYPRKAITDRTPQYILLAGITADGKTIAGMIVDFSGFICQPIIYKENEAGEWTYQIIGDEYINPNHIVLPEFPGEAPNVANYMTLAEIFTYNKAVEDTKNLKQPLVTDYMTPEKKAEYEADMEKFGYVHPSKYMTEEEMEAYNAAIDQYYIDLYPKPVDYITDETRRNNYLADYAAWKAKYDEYSSVMDNMLESAVQFEMNGYVISQDGRYLALAGFPADSDYLQTYIYDLTTGEFTTKGVKGVNIAPVYITNDGRILASKPYSRRDPNAATYFASSLTSDFTLLQDIMKTEAPDVYSFMEKNMIHEVWVWDDDIEEDVKIKQWVVGAASCDADIKTVTTWNINTWNEQSSQYVYSYCMPMPESMSLPVSIENISETSASNVTIYDTNGRMVYNGKAPQTKAETGLKSGMYIIKQGRKVKKVVI